MEKRSDYRKLEVIIADLNHIKREFLPDDGSVVLTEDDVKSFDNFQKAKYELSLTLRELQEDVNRLVELKTNLGSGKDRNTDTIRLESANRKKLGEAMIKFQKLKQTLEKGKKQDPQEQAERTKMVTLLFQEIQTLNAKNSRVKPSQGDTSESNSSSEQKESRQDKRKRDRKERKDRRTRRESQSAESEEDNEHSMSQEEINFMAEVEKNEEEQNILLDEISRGMDELKQISLDINKEFKVQEHLITTIDHKVEVNTTKIKTANRRMKDILEKSGGMGLWCPRLMCLVMVVGLGTYAYHLRTQ